MEITNNYYPLSNPTYLDEERKSNLFLESTIDYFVFFVPFTIIIVLIFNRLFHFLFDYEISKYLGIYSFWWIFLDVMIQTNIEFFVFLGFRNFATFFQFSVESKLLMVLNTIMFFLTLIAAFTSFIIYYSEYGRLGKYFLLNMFRFPSSYLLMTLVHGVRPFLKGAVHALFYERWELQIWMLIGVELLSSLVVLGFEFGNDNHRSKPIFMMDMAYSACIICMNLLILFKYEYFKESPELMDLGEEVIGNVIYLMVGLLLIKLLYEMNLLSFIKFFVLCKAAWELKLE